MKLELSRRDLFLAGGGAVAGIALSPVPWKLLDDLSIWTQQPPTPTPRPAGPLAFRFTSCALCPASCGLKARCFGAQPVGFAAVPGHPASDGGLCPLGLTAHHLAKHPLRATRPERVSGGKRERIDRAAAVATLSAALAACGKEKRTFAVVDGRPGGSLSRAWRALAAATGGRGFFEGDPRRGPRQGPCRDAPRIRPPGRVPRVPSPFGRAPRRYDSLDTEAVRVGETPGFPR